MKNIHDKLVKKRQLLAERTALALGTDTESAARLLAAPRQQSLRLNPLRYQSKELVLEQLSSLGWEGEAIAWAKDCYTILEGLEAVRDSQLVQDGVAYIQNAASWLPVLALEPQSGETILDMCAAPGGKASHIAALTNNHAALWVNDNSRARLAKLQANLTRLGTKAEYMLYDARFLARKLPDMRFDKILLDAPCSGEGMININSDKDMSTWSVAHIRRLQALQKQLIVQAWHLLKPGGTLVYSTCTTAPEENEMIIDYLRRKQTNAHIHRVGVVLPNSRQPVMTWNDKNFDAEIENCLRLAPSLQIEAFFVASIWKEQECDVLRPQELVV